MIHLESSVRNTVNSGIAQDSGKPIRKGNVNQCIKTVRQSIMSWACVDAARRHASSEGHATELQGLALWTASWGLSVSPPWEVFLSQTLKQHDLHHSLTMAGGGGWWWCRFTFLVNQKLPAIQNTKSKRTTSCLSISNPQDQHRESMDTIDQGLTPSYCGLTCGDTQSGYVNFKRADWNLPGTPPPAPRAGDCPTSNSQRLSASFQTHLFVNL